MRTLKLTLLPAAVAVFALAGASAHAAAERHYDCTKAGNANKAECKAAAKPAATPAPAPAKPVAVAKPAPAPAAPASVAAAKPPKPSRARPPAAPGAERARSPAQLANDNKMKACGAKWQALSAGDKQRWDAKGATRKDKNGHPETGWITFSSDCRKSA